MKNIVMNFSLCIWLKQHRISVGGVLLAIAVTACTASLEPQPPAANTPPIASPSIASSPTLPPTAPTQSTPSPTTPSVSPPQSIDSANRTQQGAVQVIRDYYSAINRRDYEQAYLAWEGGGTASQQSFEQFRGGFANTVSTAVEVGQPGRLDGAAGSLYIEIPVTVIATTLNGTPQRFRGSYVLRQVNNVPGSTSKQRRWHLYSANVTQVN